MMKLYIIAYIGGQLVMGIGPVPYPVRQCVDLIHNNTPQLAAFVAGIMRVDPRTISFVCEERNR